MLKKYQRRRMTDEQRKWIERQPGVIVHERKSTKEGAFFQPAFPASGRMSVTASELIDSGLDEWLEE